jgi:hypothetical protein
MFIHRVVHFVILWCAFVYILVHTILVCRFSSHCYKLLLLISSSCSACLLYIIPVNYFFFSSVLSWTGKYSVSGHDVYYCGVIVAVGCVVSACVIYQSTTGQKKRKNSSLE